MKYFISAIASGLVSGSLYASMALGMTIIYGVIHVFNFGHGIVAVMGGYLAWYLMISAGLGALPAFLFSTLFMFFVGWLIFKLTIKSLLKSPNWEFSCIIFLLGFGILLENVILGLFGPRVKDIPSFFDGSIRMGFLRLSWHDIGVFGIVIGLVIVLNLFFKKTWVGQSMRAVAQDMDGARIIGISIDKTFGYAFALSIAVTGFSGILLGAKYYMTPHIGWDWMVKAFVIVCLGGLGSVTGAIYAAFLMGLLEAFITLYLGSLWVWPSWFVVFVIILLIRPQGIAGGRTL